MALPNVEWTTDYPALQDTGVNGADEQPDQVNDAVPGDDTGNRVLVSHFHTLRNKAHALAQVIGDDSGLPSGCLRSKLSAWNFFTLTQPTGIVEPVTLLLNFDGSGGQGNDLSGNGLNVTSTLYPFKAGNRMATNGIVIPYNPLINLDAALTLELIVTDYTNLYDPGVGTTLGFYIDISSLGDGADSLFTFGNYTLGAGLAARHMGATFIGEVAAPTVLPTGHQTYVAVTREPNGEDYKIYVEDELVGSGTAMQGGIPSGPPVVGGTPETRSLFAGLTSVGIQSIKLTAGVAFSAGQLAESRARVIL